MMNEWTMIDGLVGLCLGFQQTLMMCSQLSFLFCGPMSSVCQCSTNLAQKLALFFAPILFLTLFIEHSTASERTE